MRLRRLTRFVTSAGSGPFWFDGPAASVTTAPTTSPPPAASYTTATPCHSKRSTGRIRAEDSSPRWYVAVGQNLPRLPLPCVLPFRGGGGFERASYLPRAHRCHLPSSIPGSPPAATYLPLLPLPLHAWAYRRASAFAYTPHCHATRCPAPAPTPHHLPRPTPPTPARTPAAAPCVCGTRPPPPFPLAAFVPRAMVEPLVPLQHTARLACTHTCHAPAPTPFPGGRRTGPAVVHSIPRALQFLFLTHPSPVS